MRLTLIPALALALSSCATTAQGTHDTMQALSLNTEIAYAASTAVGRTLILTGVLAPARVKADDAKAYGVLITSRALHDIARPVTEAIDKARRDADRAHVGLQIN